MMKPNSLDEEYNRFLQRAFQNGPKAPRTFDDAAIERILGKIRRKHWRQSLNREALAQELERARGRFESWEATEEGPTKKQRKDDLEQVRKAIERLKKALSPPDKVRANWLAWALCDAAPRLEAGPPDAVVPSLVMANLSVLEEAAQKALDRISEGPPHTAEPPIGAQDDLISARRWIIGRELPKIFSRYFKSKPRGVSHRTGSTGPDGPAIDFVLAVLSIANTRPGGRHTQPPELKKFSESSDPEHRGGNQKEICFPYFAT